MAVLLFKFRYKLFSISVISLGVPYIYIYNQLPRGLLFNSSLLMRDTLEVAIEKGLIVFLLFMLVLKCAKRSAFLPDLGKSLVLHFFK